MNSGPQSVKNGEENVVKGTGNCNFQHRNGHKKLLIFEMIRKRDGSCTDQEAMLCNIILAVRIETAKRLQPDRLPMSPEASHWNFDCTFLVP